MTRSAVFSSASISGNRGLCGVRAGKHPGRQWTQTLRTLTVLELEYLGLNDKTIDGLIRSSVLRNGRQGPDRESFGAELSAVCMTAMISGPRCGSTSELQRAADATPFRARRQYTPPFPLFPRRRRYSHIRRRALLDSA